MHRIFVTVCLLLAATPSQAAIVVTDDLGAKVELPAPAQRIVSLAPHATELLFAAGAGNKIVGVVKYSDYPPQAQQIPQVGGYKALDLERIVALKPDLVVAWPSGNKPAVVEQLKSLGLTVYQSQPDELSDVAQNLRQLGKLAGTEGIANQAAQNFTAEHQALKQQYAAKPPVTVFYQIWNQPIMTINGQHLISKVINLCGGKNVFESAQASAPKLDVEAVLAANPQVIVASGMGEDRPDWVDDWKKWPQLQAVKTKQLYFIPPDIIQRHSPRILQGAKQLCEALDKAR
ncbi:MAG: cobalamin-binding protein [Gammaproteobacteria bacterium]|nr:cobalamin-binding protein [Gammaproteobacteria bacterium]